MAGRKKIASPNSEHEICRFLKEVEEHPDCVEVIRRLNGLEQEVIARGVADVTRWSILRHNSRTQLGKQRRDLYERILREKLNPGAFASKPRAVILLGPPGAGKTTIGVPMVVAKFNTIFSSINADDVKERLPEYEGWNAAALHAESAHVAENLMMNVATATRLNIIYDITGKNAKKVELGLVDFAESGYEVYLLLMCLAPWKAAARAWNRFQLNPFCVKRKLQPGRYVPPRFVYEKMANHPRETFEQLKSHEAVAGYCHVDADTPRGMTARVIKSKGW